MPSPRRSFLKKGLLGGALLALGGGGLALVPPKTRQAPRQPLLSLSEPSFQVLMAFAARVVVAPGADPAEIAQGADLALSYALPESRTDLDRLLRLFDNALAGLLLDQRWTPFTRLAPEDQDRVIERWRTSSLELRRTGYQALRKLCLAAHYTGEASWAGLGYSIPVGINQAAYQDSKVGLP
jgi:hypothetical protein